MPNIVNPLKKVKRLRDSNIPKEGFPLFYIFKNIKCDSKQNLVGVDKYLSFEMVRGKIKQKSNGKDKGSSKQKGKKIKWG